MKKYIVALLIGFLPFLACAVAPQVEDPVKIECINLDVSPGYVEMIAFENIIVFDNPVIGELSYFRGSFTNYTALNPTPYNYEFNRSWRIRDKQPLVTLYNTSTKYSNQFNHMTCQIKQC